jgi:hypothetical protein
MLPQSESKAVLPPPVGLRFRHRRNRLHEGVTLFAIADGAKKPTLAPVGRRLRAPGRLVAQALAFNPKVAFW